MPFLKFAREHDEIDIREPSAIQLDVIPSLTQGLHIIPDVFSKSP
jgi:hypothetical protein